MPRVRQQAVDRSTILAASRHSIRAKTPIDLDAIPSRPAGGDAAPGDALQRRGSASLTMQALADTRRPPSTRRSGSTSPRVFATISGSPAVAANAQW
jgi:hypothetical protein